MDIKFAVLCTAGLLAAGCFDSAFFPESQYLFPEQRPAAAESVETCGGTQLAMDWSVGWPSPTDSAPSGAGILYADQFDPLGREPSAIVRVDPTTGEREAVTSTRGFPQPFAVSPDGRWIAFAQDPISIPIDLTVAPMELLIVSSDGSRTNVIRTSDKPISGLSWSPDSRSLAFITDRSLWRYDSVETTTTPISEVRGDDLGRYHQAAWSPAGDWLVHSAFTYGRVARVRPDGSDRQLLAAANDFSWSPDGSVLALADPSGLALVDSGLASRAYVAAGTTIGAVWNHDGDALAFYADDGYLQGPLCVIDARGSLREVAPCAYGGSGSTIAWSLDSTRIAFTEVPSPCLDTSEQRLAVVDVQDGTITPLGADLAFPVWVSAAD